MVKKATALYLSDQRGWDIFVMIFSIVPIEASVSLRKYPYGLRLGTSLP